MNKYTLPIVILAATVIASTVCTFSKAESVNSYEGQSAAYGLNAVQYISSYDGYNQIFCSGEDAYTYTSTNVRSLPDASSDKKDTLDRGTKVKVWGYADCGWCHVYFTGKDGQAASGYIRSDLLDLQPPQAEE